MAIRRYLGPIITVKRTIDRQLYAINASSWNLVASFRQWVSLTRRIDSDALRVGAYNSSARDLWVRCALKQIPPRSRLLDAGAGEQKYRSSCSHLEYFSQDNVAYDGKGDGQGGHVEGWTYGLTDYVCDISSIPAESESFDAILCTEVLEHLPDPIAAVTELTRLLRPGGLLILTAPFCSFTHFSPYFYSTGFSRNWYVHHLGTLGFTDIELTPNGNFFEYLAQEVRRLPRICSNYTSHADSWLVRLAILVLLYFLEKCSSDDMGSSEYSCYGWHIKAVKGTYGGHKSN
jgi:SAM-dependent methyltransferase